MAAAVMLYSSVINMPTMAAAAVALYSSGININAMAAGVLSHHLIIIVREEGEMGGRTLLLTPLL